jgi:hypothetical protein
MIAMLNYGRIGGSVQRGNIVNTAEELVNTVTDTVIASSSLNQYNREKFDGGCHDKFNRVPVGR